MTYHIVLSENMRVIVCYETAAYSKRHLKRHNIVQKMNDLWNNNYNNNMHIIKKKVYITAKIKLLKQPIDWLVQLQGIA